jgi:CHASE3 domain sensor protein
MSRRLSKISKPLIVAGMLVPVLLLIAVGIMLRRSHQSLLTSSHWVAHTIKVESELASLHSLIAEAESAQRSFLLTANPEYLTPLHRLLTEIPAEEKNLVVLTVDNASQQERLKKLGDAITARLDLMQQTAALASHDQREEALRIVNSGKGRQLMNEIRALIADASTEEDALLKSREATLAERSGLHANIAYALIAFTGLTVLGVLFLLWRNQRAQALITVCAWSKTIEHDGEWLSFEDYLQKRFGFNISHGISPEEAAKFTESLAARRKEKAAA